MGTDLENIREFVYDARPSYPDLSNELAQVSAERDNLRHRVMVLEHEVRGLYAKLELITMLSEAGCTHQEIAAITGKNSSCQHGADRT